MPASFSSHSIKLIDIARQAGVTPAVVSHVLNNRQSTIRVSAQKREAILAIAKKMEYLPDINARALRGGATGMLGVFIDSQAPQIMFQLIQSLEVHLNGIGKRLLIGESHENLEAMKKSFRQINLYGVDGFIIISHDYPDMNREIADFFAHSPRTVFIGKPFIPGCTHVIPDLGNGIREAVRHLLERGRRRIAKITLKDAKDCDVLEQNEVFVSESPDGGELLIPVKYPKVSFDDLRLELRQVIQDIIVPRKVDAIIAINDTVALLIYHELLRVGLRVPDDVALVGHDNLSVSQCMLPRLTTIDMDMDKVAAEAVNAISQLMQNGTANPASVSVPSRLVIREST